MKSTTLMSLYFLALSTATAMASRPRLPMHRVPEIDATTGIAALGLVGAVVALMWERRRNHAE